MLRFRYVNIIAALVIFGLLLGWYFFQVPFWIILIVFGLWLSLTLLGSFFIGWNYHINSLNNNSEISQQQVSITFDDGPHPEYTPQALKLLEKYNAKATFFCIGKHIESNPELFKSILQHGHSIGNHTYSHSNYFGFYNTPRVVSELERTNKIVKEYTSLELLLYRPAFGVTNPKIKKALQITGLQSIGWNKRSLDTTNLSERVILKRITRKLKKGDVILLHDSSTKSIAVLEQLLLFLQGRKIESVTIEALFNIKAYA